MSVDKRITKPGEGYTDRINLLCPQIGIVKDTGDSQSMGRIKVWILGSTSLEQDESGWITCNYSSPFAGATDSELLGNNIQNPDETQEAYGFWAIPPDINNQVIVQFINGDIAKAYWTGCIYQKNMNYEIPGSAAGNAYHASQFPAGSLIPVLEYNKLGDKMDPRPYNQTLAAGLELQGLITDPLRGAGTSSARRESPSQVFGMRTPGGNTFVMDDGDGSEMIRFRTASGAQILISETNGNIYVISRDGNNWLELTNDGYIDAWSSKGINFNTDGDFNIRAGGNVNIEAGGDTNIKGESAVNLQASTDSINLNAANDINLKTDENSVNIKSAGDYNISINGGINQTVQGTITTWQADGAARVSDDFTHPGSTDDSEPTQPTAAETPIIYQQHLKDLNGNEVPVESICDRVPDAEPWPLHAIVPPDPIAPNSVKAVPNNVSVGSIIPNASQPLPLTGSPLQGMAPGIYTPNGYDKKGNPQYIYNGSSTALLPLDQLVTSQAGIDFIKAREYFSPVIYKDATTYAIGYGHDILPTDRPPISTGPIDEQTASDLLASDLKTYEGYVRKYITVPLTQPQFDALVSWTYNVGGGGLQKSELRTQLNAGNYSQVPNLMTHYVKATVGGIVRNPYPPLVARRQAEGLLFSTPVATA